MNGRLTAISWPSAASAKQRYSAWVLLLLTPTCTRFAGIRSRLITVRLVPCIPVTSGERCGPLTACTAQRISQAHDHCVMVEPTCQRPFDRLGTEKSGNVHPEPRCPTYPASRDESCPSGHRRDHRPQRL